MTNGSAHNEFDVIIRNGMIIDGSGNPWYTADIGVSYDSIAAVGNLTDARARLELDATGLAVAPGFIDIHTHSDLPLLVDGLAQAHVRQGVTTNVVGNCGSSLAPVSDTAAKRLGAQRLAEYDIEWDWKSLAEYLAKLEGSGVSINVVPLVGHGTMRDSVMGSDDRQPTARELATMQDMLDQAMQEGAFGLSTGLIYVPGSYADTDEIIELARVAAEYDGMYATHIRGENDTLLDALHEAIEIGRQAHLRVQVSHLKAMGRHMWGKSVEALELIDSARDEGIEITCDQYPYNASATGLGAYLPHWAHVGGRAELEARLRDPDTRARLKADILEGTDDWVSLYRGVGWDNTLISSYSQHDLEGLSIAEIAQRQGKDAFDAAFDLLLEAEGRVGVVYFTIGDEDIERIMRHPAVMVGSDSSAIATEGPLARGKPHPRAFGSFVRVLGRYVREKGTVRLEEAVRKMTSLPAQSLRLLDRGLLRPGMKADIVVFDPETVADLATYTDPFQYPVGIRDVVVNGALTIHNGQHLGTRAGMVLRLRN